MSTPDSNASSEEPASADFAQQLRSTMQAVHDGHAPTDALLRLARSQEQETIQYCVQRMTEPELNLMEEMMITRLLQQAGLVRRFVGALLSLDPQAAKDLALKFRNAERGLDLKIAPFLQSEDSTVVMQSLDLLEIIAESKQIVPVLFGLIGSDDQQIQSKAALIIQKLDSEQAYTRRMLQHPDARVRANALQGIVDRATEQGAEFLLQGLTDADHRVRTLAAVGLARMGDPQGFQVLLRMLRSPKPIDRRSAVWGLGVCGNVAALPRLETLAQDDPDDRVRELAAQACRKIMEANRGGPQEA